MDRDITKEQEEYVRSVIESLTKDQNSLNSEEKSLGSIYMKSQNRLQQFMRDREIVGKQLNEMQNRLAQLNQTIDLEAGKASGILESLISLKFAEIHQ